MFSSQQRSFMNEPEGPELSTINETIIRHGFIRKVYGLLGFQLILTVLVGAIVMSTFKAMVHQAPGLVMALIFGCLCIYVMMMCVFMCCPGYMRKSPTNYILLFVFTGVEGVLLGFISVQYTTESVVLVFALTAFIVVALSIFACQTSIDFTGCGVYLFGMLMCLMGLGLAMSIVRMCGLSGPAFETMRLCYAALGALIFSCYLIFDTQMIVGGKHKRFRFSIDDYCMATLVLYLDIIQIFLYLLQLFGERRN